MTFLNTILNQSKKHEFPFDHWEYNNALSEDAIEEINAILDQAYEIIEDSISSFGENLKEKTI